MRIGRLGLFAAAGLLALGVTLRTAPAAVPAATTPREAATALFQSLHKGATPAEVRAKLGKREPLFVQRCEDGSREDTYLLSNGRGLAPDLVTLYFDSDERLVRLTHQKAKNLTPGMPSNN